MWRGKSLMSLFLMVAKEEVAVIIKNRHLQAVIVELGGVVACLPSLTRQPTSDGGETRVWELWSWALPIFH